MNILAINTAFPTADLALEIERKEVGDKKNHDFCLAEQKKSVFYKSLDSNCKHSENILAAIDDMCQTAGVDILDVDTLAVVIGPGSFTGLRVGVAIARALGCVNKKLRFVALSSLEFMAFCAKKQHNIETNFACAINALSNLCFLAYFDTKGIILYEEKLTSFAEFEKLDLPKFVLKGDFSCNVGKEITLSAQQLLEFSKQVVSQGKFVPLQQLLPKYIRLSQAEDSLLKKNVKKD